jgi:hypothetical protein
MMCISYMSKDMSQRLVVDYKGDAAHDDVYILHVKRIIFIDL